MPKSDPMARQRAVDKECKCETKPVPPEMTCTPSFSKNVVPDKACTPGSSKRKEGGAHASATNAGKWLRQQKMTDTYGGEWIGQWRKAFFRWVYSSGIAFNAFRNTPYRDLQQVALRQPGGAPLPVLPSHSEIASMRAVEIHREELAEELEAVRQPLWVVDTSSLGSETRACLTLRRDETWSLAARHGYDGGRGALGIFRGTKERSPTTEREDTRPCTTLREETLAPMTASEEPGPTTTTRERTTVSSTVQEQTPAPTTTREQTSIPATQSAPSSQSPLSRHSIPASAPTAPVRHDERSPAPVGREDLRSSLRIRGHGSLFSVGRQLVLDPRASSDLGEKGVNSGAPPVEERERQAEEHGAAGAGGVEGIRGMEDEVAGAVGGVVEVDDGAHVEREEAMARVDDGEQVEGVEGVLPSEVERERDVARTQVEREEGVVGVDDGDAQVEMEEDVVRADAAALVGGEEGVVGGDVAHGRGEGGDDLDPIVQRFGDDEIGPALAGLTAGTRRALGASPSGQRRASGLGMGDFMDMSVGDPPSPSHADREDVVRSLAAAGYSTEEIEQAFAGCSGRETDTLQQGCEEVVEQPQAEREDAPAADIPRGSSSLVPFTGMRMTRTMRPAALAAATRVVRDQTSCTSGVARPRPMPATGGAALGESSEAEGLGMPRGSRREKTVAEVTQVSARLVRVRTGADPVAVVEDDPETEPACEEAAQEGDEYRDDEERDEEESDNGDDDNYHNDDDEPSPPAWHGSRRRRGSRRRHDDVDDPSPPGRRETRSWRRRGSSVATVPGRGSVSSTRSTSGARQRGSGKGKGSRRY
ncbi:hypothetical protein CBR_g56040 [Chara braunii]|uniref:Uncharacterized protein n=1 Tax=Chara braunii TaxID=69332 RepID=A0A388MDC8_CHABU|nr:hypothetical protein CBR_g56040 [Chara braunii]|eukprot:GBG92567.1 hypothetical protein CBR_g56040 [Chara braunii]